MLAIYSSLTPVSYYSLLEEIMARGVSITCDAEKTNLVFTVIALLTQNLWRQESGGSLFHQLLLRK